jgi:hypothetical protein
VSSAAVTNRRPIWWWSLWLVLGLAIGLQALRIRIGEAAVDSLAGNRAVLVRPQNGWGQALLAEKRFASGDVGAAVESSRRALVRTPLAVSAVRTLARSLDSRSEAGGERAWQIASNMGWRDGPTQLWALLRAMFNGQADIFAMRADALMRTRGDDPRMLAVIRAALIEPRIRQALADRIGLNPQWRSRLFIAGRPLAGRELDGALQTLRALGRTNAPPDRRELRDSIAGLIAANRFDEAVALDRAFVRRKPDPGSLIDDGGFDRLEDYAGNGTPFDWTIIKSAVLDESGGQRSVLLTREERRAPLVRRIVPLAPGSYRLSYAIKGDLESPAAIGILLRCTGRDANLASSSRQPLSGSGWQTRAIDFAVPLDCPLITIDLTSMARGDHAEAQFDNFAITQRP